MAKHPPHILELAKRGAEHRVQELKAELAALEEVLTRLRHGSAVSPAVPNAMEEPTVRPRRRRRRKMSEAARKVVSDRMKKYWATKRKSKK